MRWLALDVPPVQAGTLARIGVELLLPSMRFGNTPDSACRFPTSPAALFAGNPWTLTSQRCKKSPR